MRHFFTSRLVRAGTCLCVLLGSAESMAWGWGREGHRLTALVAESYLTPEAKVAAAALLQADGDGKASLADISSWADDYRRQAPETGAWHFVDIPGSATTFDRQRDCPVSATDAKSPWRDCVTDRILYFEGRLGDTSLSAKDHAVALKFLVHFIGDVHQPLHAIGDERGGNEIRVGFISSSQCGSSGCNLHGIWDEGMIEERHLSERSYLELLEKDIAQNHWEQMAGGEPTTWANISHKYALNAMVPNGTMLGRDYYEEEIKVVDSQLALGGLRLARVLNRILAPAPAATKTP